MSFWRGAAKSQKANKLGDWNLRWNRQGCGPPKLFR
jgi:hypothetical protein